GEIGLFFAPQAREGAYVLGWHASLGRLPLGRFWRAVGFAEQIGLPLFKACRARCDIVFVIELFCHPYIHDCLGESRVGLWSDWNPASAQQLRGGIEMRVDMDELNPQPFGPEPALSAFEAGIAAVRAFRVARPEDDQLGFLETILDAAVAGGDSNPHGIAVMMHRAPVPTFPTVRVGRDASEADQIGEPHERTEVIADISPLVMRRHREGDRTGTMDTLLPIDLLGDNVQRLVPAYPHVTGFAAILWIAFAIRIKIHPLHWVKNAFVRINNRFER